MKLPKSLSIDTFLFISLLVVLPCLAFYIGTVYHQNQSQVVSIDYSTTNQLSIDPSTASTQTPSQNSNILDLGDIQMDLPNGWVVESVSQNQAKILTNYPTYQVYLILDFEKNTLTANESYQTYLDTATQTDSGLIYNIPIGGGLACTGAFINDNSYQFFWSLESNQPTPVGLDEIWVPDHDVTPDMILDITKTIKPTITSNSLWQSYSNSNMGIALKYPKNWEVEVGTNSLYIRSKETSAELTNKNNTWTRVGDIIVTKTTSSQLPNNTNNLSLSSWITSEQAKSYGVTLPPQPYNQDGLSGYKVTSCGNVCLEEIYLDRSGIIYIIDSGNSQYFTDQLNQIVSTFSFI